MKCSLASEAGTRDPGFQAAKSGAPGFKPYFTVTVAEADFVTVPVAGEVAVNVAK